MPVATRPNATYEVVLSTDMDLPEAERPVFIFRYMSLFEWEKIAELDDEFQEATEAKNMIDLALKVIGQTLCDWRNMKMPDGKMVPYNQKKLRSLISMKEVTELMMVAVSQRPSLEDKKKFDLPSDSNTAGSAETAKE